jgi:hypothetical protein
MDLFKPMDSFVRVAKTGSFTVAAARALFRDTLPHAKADPIHQRTPQGRFGPPGGLID